MKAISEDEIARMRVDLGDTLPEMCTIIRKVYSSDEAGGQNETRSTIGNFSCRIGIAENNPQYRAIAGQLESLMVYVLTLPAETDVRAGDEVLIGQRNFAVKGVIQQSYEIARRCVCVEV